MLKKLGLACLPVAVLVVAALRTGDAPPLEATASRADPRTAPGRELSSRADSTSSRLASSGARADSDPARSPSARPAAPPTELTARERDDSLRTTTAAPSGEPTAPPSGKRLVGDTGPSIGTVKVLGHRGCDTNTQGWFLSVGNPEQYDFKVSDDGERDSPRASVRKKSRRPASFDCAARIHDASASSTTTSKSEARMSGKTMSSRPMSAPRSRSSATA